jgi:hypothetical protein
MVMPECWPAETLMARAQSCFWVTKSVAVAVNSALHHLHPAKLGTIGAFLVCFVIVVSPSSFFRVRLNIENVNDMRAEALTHPVFQSVGAATVRDFSPERSDQAVEQAEWALRASRVEERNSGSESPPTLNDNMSVEGAKRNLLVRQHAKQVQERLVELGYLSGSATGVWGPRSQRALRAFKADRDLAADAVWDESTERNLFTDRADLTEGFVGIWGTEVSACSPRLNQQGLLPAVIDGEGAWAGETRCAFQRKKRTADGWNFVASCFNGHDRWTANIRLVVNGDRLTWTSERGSQSYLRCKTGPSIAGAF